MFLILVSLLGLGSIGPSTVFAATPNDFLKTGDRFTFTQDRDEYFGSSFSARIYNDSDDNQVYRQEEEFRDETVLWDNTLDMFILRNRDTLPLPPGTDTVIKIDQRGQSTAGSERDITRNLYDLGPELNGTWKNETMPTEDLSGMHLDNQNHGDNFIDMATNATYAVMFPEMVESSTYLPINDFLPFQVNGEFPNQIPLVSRNVTSDSKSLNINGANAVYSLTVVSSLFSDVLTSVNFTAYVPIGDNGGQDCNDGYCGGPTTQVNGTFDLTAEYSAVFSFDSVSGMIVSAYIEQNYVLHVDLLNPSVQNPNEGPQTFGLQAEFDTSVSVMETTTMSQTNAGFGNPRPVSNGVNRLSTGDILKYWTENSFESSSNMEFTAKFDGNPVTYGRSESEQESRREEGTSLIDVYRHQPGSFEALIISNTTGSSDWSKQWSETNENGTTSNSDSGSYVDEHWRFNVEAFGGLSSDDQEIVAFFEDEYYMPNFFNDGNDGFYFPVPQKLTKNGTVMNEFWHHHFNGTDDNEPITINGHEYTYINLNVYHQRYDAGLTQTNVPIPFGDVEIHATVSVHASVKVTYYYENTTGVLVAREERFDIKLSISANEKIDVNQDEGQTVQMDISMEMQADLRFNNFILLLEHPNELLTAPGPDTFDHDATTTTTTTNVTTVTDGNATSEEAPELPAPVSIAPIFTAMLVTAVIIRKKKY